MKHITSLRSRKDFDLVYGQKYSKANRLLVIYLRKNTLDCHRLGISVSKKVGNSVVRHRVTRLIRESYRLNEEQIAQGYDIVVIARSGAKGTDYADIESAFIHLLKKFKIYNNPA